MSKIGNFFCVDCNCGAKLKKRDFQINLAEDEDLEPLTYLCPNNIPLKLMGYQSATFVIDKAKHAKGRTETEKIKRNSGHFEKEILPTLGGMDRKHHEKKIKLRKQGKIK